MSTHTLHPSRVEVMTHIEGQVQKMVEKFLRPIELNWQPSDLLPDASNFDFFDAVKDLQRRAKELSYDFWVVLIGDMITEEALPTYESWLMSMSGVNQGNEESPWTVWIKGWTAEENRHGDLLNKYLYLSGRVNMREVEASTQYLISCGFDIGTATDPYRNFIYTSFQELATYISHKRVAELARYHDNTDLAKICDKVGDDEYRHAYAYMSFIEAIMSVDVNEALIAFEDMMRKKIVMPAHYLKETGAKVGDTFRHFSESAQRLGVYTAVDYIDILDILLKQWKLADLTDLNEAGEKARDYLMKLPSRLLRVAERMKTPPRPEYEFKWVGKRQSKVFMF